MYRMLNNPFYYGIMKNAEGEYIRHKYDAIITKELFDKVQERLRSDRKRGEPKVRRNYGQIPFMFSGLIRCAKCQYMITAERQKEYVYLKCSKGKKKCSQSLVNEKVLVNQLFDEVFNNIKIPSRLAELLKANIKDYFNKEKKLNSSIKKAITDEIKSLETKLDTLIDKSLDGGPNAELYEKQISKVSIRIQELKTEYTNTKELSSEFTDTLDGIVDIMANAKQVMARATPHQKRELLGVLLENCYLNDKVLTYKVKRPFDKLIGKDKGENWFDVSTIEHEQVLYLSSDVRRIKERVIEV